MTRRRKKQNTGILAWLARAAIFLIMLVIAAIAFTVDQVKPTSDTQNSPPTLRPTSTGRTATSAGLIKIYFTTPDLVYPDKRDQRNASPLEQAVIADIAAAKRSIDVAVFDFDLNELGEALIAAKQRGVTVRMVIDSENLAAPEVSEITGRLSNAGVPITFDDRSAFMHNKFLVIDSQIAWMGSWNMTENDTFRNNNNMLRLRSQLAARSFQEEFNQMFDGIFGPKKAIHQRPEIILDQTPIRIYFSPEDGVAKYILAELQQAKKSIRFMAFSFTADPIAQAMIEQAKAGLTVQGVFERQNASGTGATFAELQSGGVDVLEDGSCYILHHKTIIIDDRIVITGSYNFTNNAERSNDESLVIISDPEVASIYQAEFERIHTQATSPLRCQ
ncbi:MAG: phospholipase D-like domain-containing protein [Roseiflexaceae bacterium]|nr:phospholipase D-like domain-containing protein [Roseiflexaceae bacterium]